MCEGRSAQTPGTKCSGGADEDELGGGQADGDCTTGLDVGDGNGCVGEGHFVDVQAGAGREAAALQIVHEVRVVLGVLGDVVDRDGLALRGPAQGVDLGTIATGQTGDGVTVRAGLRVVQQGEDL